MTVKFHVAFSYFKQKEILRDQSHAKINKTQLRYAMTLQTERDPERPELQAKINKNEMEGGERGEKATGLLHFYVWELYMILDADN